ncbi:MAG: methyltransferase [Gemmatimonadaceae bacterium]|nr:methyltransferase [Gemmatimonadaceae bacterium]
MSDSMPAYGLWTLVAINSAIFVIFSGFWLLAAAWNVLYAAQRSENLAVTGPYARIRHPQYAAFILIMTGFVLQWPTLPTLLMFPVLVVMYFRLARVLTTSRHLGRARGAMRGAE